MQGEIAEVQLSLYQIDLHSNLMLESMAEA